MLESIKANGAAEAGQTLVSLDMLHEISTNATGDQLRADMFFRYNQSLQHFFRPVRQPEYRICKLTGLH